MAFDPKTGMQTYVHAKDDNTLFARGFAIGVGTGLVGFLIALALAYALNFDGIRSALKSLFQAL